MTTVQLLLTLLGLGIVAGIIQAAPVVAAEFKRLIVWVLLVVAVICIATYFGIWQPFLRGIQHGFDLGAPGRY